MKTKEFDAVVLMRELRDRLSEKYAVMSIEEEIADLQRHINGCGDYTQTRHQWLKQDKDVHALAERIMAQRSR
jgi:hypothetical protein